jgi:hypothetical protein
LTVNKSGSKVNKNVAKITEGTVYKSLLPGCKWSGCRGGIFAMESVHVKEITCVAKMQKYLTVIVI